MPFQDEEYIRPPAITGRIQEIDNHIGLWRVTDIDGRYDGKSSGELENTLLVAAKNREPQIFIDTYYRLHRYEPDAKTDALLHEVFLAHVAASHYVDFSNDKAVAKFEKSKPEDFPLLDDGKYIGKLHSAAHTALTFADKYLREAGIVPATEYDKEFEEKRDRLATMLREFSGNPLTGAQPESTTKKKLVADIAAFLVEQHIYTDKDGASFAVVAPDGLAIQANKAIRDAYSSALSQLDGPKQTVREIA